MPRKVNPAATAPSELSSINFRSVIGGPLMAVIHAQSQAAMASVDFIKSVGFKPGNNEDPMNTETGEPIYVSFKYPKEVVAYQPAQPGGEVISIAVNAPGQDYDTVPTVKITASQGESGSGATATAIVSGKAITGVTITNPGQGYKSAPTVEFEGGSGAGASATAELSEPVDAQSPVFEDMVLEVPILTMLPIPFIRIEETTIDFNAKINSVETKQTDTSMKFDASTSVEGKYPPIFSSVSADLKVSTSLQRNTSSGYKVDRTYSLSVHVRAVQDEMPAGMERILGILEDNIKAQPA